ncbi:hypothetical protein A9Q99_00125 [Gammaproteobacteria bacterium 45_16_T64]|nr:hypothetical protein A9Q99_00125 [Gammaproteobacteria bacterium 45_16_T64]
MVGYTQDSPVSESHFLSQDLMLGDGVVTACFGRCISTPEGDYTGTLVGNFVENLYHYLKFDTVLDAAVINVYDGMNNLVETLISGGGYSYSGSTGIASFSVDLVYDGLYSLSLDNAVSAAIAVALPEPDSLMFIGIGIASLGFFRRRKV